MAWRPATVTRGGIAVVEVRSVPDVTAVFDGGVAGAGSSAVVVQLRGDVVPGCSLPLVCRLPKKQLHWPPTARPTGSHESAAALRELKDRECARCANALAAWRPTPVIDGHPQRVALVVAGRGPLESLSSIVGLDACDWPAVSSAGASAATSEMANAGNEELWMVGEVFLDVHRAALVDLPKSLFTAHSRDTTMTADGGREDNGGQWDLWTVELKPKWGVMPFYDELSIVPADEDIACHRDGDADECGVDQAVARVVVDPLALQYERYTMMVAYKAEKQKRGSKGSASSSPAAAPDATGGVAPRSSMYSSVKLFSHRDGGRRHRDLVAAQIRALDSNRMNNLSCTRQCVHPVHAVEPTPVDVDALPEVVLAATAEVLSSTDDVNSGGVATPRTSLLETLRRLQQSGGSTDDQAAVAGPLPEVLDASLLEQLTSLVSAQRRGDDDNGNRVHRPMVARLRRADDAHAVETHSVSEAFVAASTAAFYASTTAKDVSIVIQLLAPRGAGDHHNNNIGEQQGRTDDSHHSVDGCPAEDGSHHHHQSDATTSHHHQQQRWHPCSTGSSSPIGRAAVLSRMFVLDLDSKVHKPVAWYREHAADIVAAFRRSLGAPETYPQR